MLLFTISLDFKGGTYLEQVLAADEREALSKWVRNLDTGSIRGLGIRSKHRIIEELTSNFKNGIFPTPIQGLQNVWHYHFLGGLFIDIIDTRPVHGL
jgi:hypothetical protein